MDVFNCNFSLQLPFRARREDRVVRYVRCPRSVNRPSFLSFFYKNRIHGLKKTALQVKAKEIAGKNAKGKKVADFIYLYPNNTNFQMV